MCDRCRCSQSLCSATHFARKAAYTVAESTTASPAWTYQSRLSERLRLTTRPTPQNSPLSRPRTLVARPRLDRPPAPGAGRSAAHRHLLPSGRPVVRTPMSNYGLTRGFRCCRRRRRRDRYPDTLRGFVVPLVAEHTSTIWPGATGAGPRQGSRTRTAHMMGRDGRPIRPTLPAPPG